MPSPSVSRALRVLHGEVDETAAVSNGARPEALVLEVDGKGRLRLPDAPAAPIPALLAQWLTVALALDPEHPIIRGALEGLRGAAGHVVLERLDAPPLRFEPASRINTPMRLVEDRTWQGIPSDDPTPAYKGEHCRQIAHVVRQLCGTRRAMTDRDETEQIIGAYLGQARVVEGFTTHGTSPQRYEAARALQRDEDDATGRPLGPARYLTDMNTGETIIRVSDLADVARRFLGGSLQRGWLDARMENAGWARVRLDGHAEPGRDGRATGGGHARCAVYRGLMTTDAVTT